VDSIKFLDGVFSFRVVAVNSFAVSMKSTQGSV